MENDLPNSVQESQRSLVEQFPYQLALEQIKQQRTSPGTPEIHRCRRQDESAKHLTLQKMRDVDT